MVKEFRELVELIEEIYGKQKRLLSTYSTSYSASKEVGIVTNVWSRDSSVRYLVLASKNKDIIDDVFMEIFSLFRGEGGFEISCINEREIESERQTLTAGSLGDRLGTPLFFGGADQKEQINVDFLLKEENFVRLQKHFNVGFAFGPGVDFKAVKKASDAIKEPRENSLSQDRITAEVSRRIWEALGTIYQRFGGSHVQGKWMDYEPDQIPGLAIVGREDIMKDMVATINAAFGKPWFAKLGRDKDGKAACIVEGNIFSKEENLKKLEDMAKGRKPETSDERSR